jgi:hypothetical protein
MNRDHAMIEELLAVRSLAGLDGDDAVLLDRGMAEHGDCEGCRRFAAEYDETAGRLAFALDPLPATEIEADAILRRAAEAGHPSAGAGHVALGQTPPGPRLRPGRAWQALGAAAAVIVLVVAAIALLGPSRSTDVQATTSQTVVRFTGTGGELAMAYEPGRPGAVFLGSGFDDPGPDQVYEIWMIQDDTPISGGCVSPHDGSIVAFVDADVSGADLMAVTVEPASCPAQPTTTPFLSAPLTA